jgi:hypothetical protein
VASIRRAKAPGVRLAWAFSIIGRSDTVSTQFARRLSLIAFATAALRGLLGEADFFGAIQTALVALGVFYVLGLVVGEAARQMVEENAKAELAERFRSASVSGTPVPPA